MSLQRSLRLVSLSLILIGLIGVLPISYFWVNNKIAVAQNSGTVPFQAAVLKPSPDLITGKPVELLIPSLKMDLKVIDGAYNAKTGGWTLTLDKAQFALPSVQPNNEGGNTLIYGHYRPEVFAYLHLIKSGAQAFIMTDNGYTFTYTYTNTKAYDPSDTSIFAYQGAPRLTIQTCSGTFMQNRQMYYFNYDSYAKN